jgi:hypothetical protein
MAPGGRVRGHFYFGECLCRAALLQAPLKRSSVCCTRRVTESWLDEIKHAGACPLSPTFFLFTIFDLSVLAQWYFPSIIETKDGNKRMGWNFSTIWSVAKESQRQNHQYNQCHSP